MARQFKPGQLQTGSLYNISASYALTASHVKNAQTASYLDTLNQDLTFNGNLTLNGTASISYLNVTYETASVIYSSGSNQFGDAVNDVQTLIGRTIVSGSLEVTGSLNAPNITGSLFGTASYALSSSHAQTAQNAINSITPVLNQSGADILKGAVVHITGSQNQSDIPRIRLADYTNDNLSANTLGLVTTDIPNGSSGYALTDGLFVGYDTSTPGWIAGQLIYLGANGTITGSAPQAPLHSVRLGQVVRVQSQNGTLYIRIDNGYELGELHDVLANDLSYGDLLMRSGSVWTNSKQLSGSYGLTGSLTATSFTGSLQGTASFANTASFITASAIAGTVTSASYAVTASYALNAGGSGAVFPFTGSAIISGSLTVTGSTNLQGSTGTTLFSSNADTLIITGSLITTGSMILTGSLRVNGSITASLFGTSSWSVNAISASYIDGGFY